jgi:hypothetical protein
MKEVLMMSACQRLRCSRVAQAQQKPEEQVEVRQAGYHSLCRKHVGKIRAMQALDGTEPYGSPRSLQPTPGRRHHR